MGDFPPVREWPWFVWAIFASGIVIVACDAFIVGSLVAGL